MFKQISHCRLCGNTELVNILNLGRQPFTHIFPKTRTQQVPAGPLTLVRCTGEPEVCGLLQLQHTYVIGALPVDGFADPTDATSYIAERRRNAVTRTLGRMKLPQNSLIVDTGGGGALQPELASGCLFARFEATNADLNTFRATHIQCIPHSFSAMRLHQYFGRLKASFVTSFSTFRNRDDPLTFMADIAQVLDDHGLCLLELAYMPSMLRMRSYDAVRHEHVGYYALRQLKWMTDRIGLKIVDAEVDSTSFSVMIAKHSSLYVEEPRVAALLDEEARAGLHTPEPYRSFARSVAESRTLLRTFFDRAKRAGKTITALGASRNGNVLLNYCNLTEADITCIGEVNPEKFRAFTPGTLLPIRTEEEILAMMTDYLLILPWHLRSYFLGLQTLTGRSLIFPLPQLELVHIARASQATERRPHAALIEQISPIDR